MKIKDMDSKLKEILISGPKVDANLIIQYYNENNNEDELEKYVDTYKYLLKFGKGWLTQPFKNILESIVSLQSIEEFVLTDVNNIFSGIGLLHSLKKLEISANTISVLPESIFQLFQLQELSIIGTSIEKIPDSIRYLSNLRKLSIIGNTKLKCLPSSLKFLDELEELDISSNAIERLPTFINSLSKLKNLILDEVRLNKDVDLKLNKFRKLEQLSLKNCRINDFNLDLSECKNLYRIVLDGNNIKEQFIKTTINNRVVYLSLENGGLTEIPKFILEFKNLSELKLSYNDITDIPVWLKKMEKLRVLDIYNTPLESLLTKERLTELLPNLEVIGMREHT